MYISHVRIENVRGFGSRNAVDIKFGRKAGWTVIAGRNGAGKSTFLRAIALAAAGPSAARALTESFRGWVRDGSTHGSATVEMVASSEDRFQGMGKLPTSGFKASLTWNLSGGAQEPSLEASPKPEKVLRGPWRGPWSDNPSGWFVAGYGPFRRLTGHAADAQRLMVAPNHVARMVSLFREDASLIECVQWLKHVYTRRLEKKPGSAELEEAVLGLLNDGLLPDKVKVIRIDSEGLWVAQGNSELPLRELSDGYRVIVALVLDIVRLLQQCYGELPVKNNNGHLEVDLPGVVLADEIDAHLHVSWQQRVGFWMKRHFPRIQFIVSTHSPYICQAADEGGLIRLPAPGELGSASMVDKETFKRVVHGTADEAVLTALFGLEKTWSDETDRLRRELSHLRAKQLQGRASRKDLSRAQQLEMDLPLTPTASVERALDDVKALLGVQAAK
ncbi:AAA family ATPase [Myxococcus sp. XM-1-1-1]|nr:AAA family ATPase [Myxococcus sp. XM-1-1-1]